MQWYRHGPNPLDPEHDLSHSSKSSSGDREQASVEHDLQHHRPSNWAGCRFFHRCYADIVCGLSSYSFRRLSNSIPSYSAPQKLSNSGNIIGHTHVTVQSLGNSITPTTPPDPQKFVFFKGINDAGNGNGLLSATVTGGLPKGSYRVCSMTSASNHQPVLMP